MGSLRSLIDSGLVTEKGSQFQRAEIKRAVAKQEPKTGDQQMAVSKQAQNALIKKPVPQDASNLDKLGALSSRVIQLAAQLKEIASDIDAAAIEIVEQKATDDANVAKLKQLQALLKEIG
jgi:outer membrane murein-binding lipoprotein Lpp